MTNNFYHDGAPDFTPKNIACDAGGTDPRVVFASTGDAESGTHTLQVAADGSLTYTDPDGTVTAGIAIAASVELPNAAST